MKICAIVKYPPIEGGVSTQSYWLCRLLAARGHQVHVVTNAGEVEPRYRAWFLDGDEARMEADFPSGGFVRVRSTGGWDDGRFGYIPAANPFATKLAAMATEVVREQDCDLILAWYLEPYGIAASLASSWTGRPFVVRHAGSDRYALMSHPELSTGYKEVLRSAAGVLTAGADFSGFDIPAERTLEVPGAYRPEEFSPTTPALDVNAVVRELADRNCPYVTNTAPVRDDVPRIGVYGKTGPTKGTFALIAALGELRRRGRPFQFLVMGGGHHWSRMVAAADEAGIGDMTWTLPFLAPWRVPGFIRACTAVCFLEHGFAVRRHTPGIAAEILACGVPLVVSREIADKQPYWDRPEDAADHFLVSDPADRTELTGVLARVLQDPAAARRRGDTGAALVGASDSDDFGARYEHALRRVGTPDAVAEPTMEALLPAHCPATVRLLGEGLADVLAESADARPNGTLLSLYRLMCRLREAGRLDGNEALPQMARAEHRFLWFAVDAEGIDGVPVFPVSTYTVPRLAELDDARVRTLRPVSSRLLRVERFDIDVPAYARRVATERAEAASTIPDRGTSHLLLFHKRPQLGGAIMRIDETVAELLGAFDGTTPLASIDGGSRPSLRRLVETLHRSRAIAFAGHGPPDPLAAAGRRQSAGR